MFSAWENSGLSSSSVQRVPLGSGVPTTSLCLVYKKVHRLMSCEDHLLCDYSSGPVKIGGCLQKLLIPTK